MKSVETRRNIFFPIFYAHDNSTTSGHTRLDRTRGVDTIKITTLTRDEGVSIDSGLIIETSLKSPPPAV